MAFISDGEQKSSIGDGLLKPWKLLLLDDGGPDQKSKSDRVIHLNEGKKTDDIISQINFKTGIDGVKINETAQQVETIIDVALAESLHPLVLHWPQGRLDRERYWEEEKARIKRESTIGTTSGWQYYFNKDSKMDDFKATRSKTRIGHENVGSLTNTREAVNRSNHRMD
ncbi:hypothetical protein JCM33374_g6681 [Metschnikowia sp. JCM 33374]|nr:hypothetical protein JCM33374_g6681 [Metschnikowia sp. JCM 33374]